MGNYNKAVAAILGGVVTVVGAIFGADKVTWATPEAVAAIGGVLTTILVYFFPPNTPD